MPRKNVLRDQCSYLKAKPERGHAKYNNY